MAMGNHQALRFLLKTHPIVIVGVMPASFEFPVDLVRRAGRRASIPWLP